VSRHRPQRHPTHPTHFLQVARLHRIRMLACNRRAQLLQQRKPVRAPQLDAAADEPHGERGESGRLPGRRQALGIDQAAVGPCGPVLVTGKGSRMAGPPVSPLTRFSNTRTSSAPPPSRWSALDSPVKWIFLSVFHLVVLILPSSAWSSALCFVCPPTDLAGRPLEVENDDATQIFCRYQTIPNDFFCKYFSDTGLLKQDQDDGFCAPVASISISDCATPTSTATGTVTQTGTATATAANPCCAVRSRNCPVWPAST